MVHKVYEIYELMPKKDCGLCGNPTCRTSARKIAAGDMSPEKCFNLKLPEYERNLECIREILKEEIESGTKHPVELEKEGVTYINPCEGEAGRIAAETKLVSGSKDTMHDLKYSFFDPFVMCWALNTSELYTDVRCSPKLGVARINLDDKTVMIFQDGRINVRKAKDRNDAIQTIRLVSRTLWASIICSYCGNAIVDCAAGVCENCLTKVCPALAGGPPDPNGSIALLTDQTTVSAIFDRAKKLKTGKYLNKGFRDLDFANTTIKKAYQDLLNGQFSIKLINSINKKLVEANNSAIHFVETTSQVQDATIGLILAGVTLDTFRISDGLASLIQLKKPIQGELSSLLTQAVKIAEQAYQSLREVDPDQAKQSTIKFMEFMKEWTISCREKQNYDSMIAIEKIAINGSYIARLSTKPLPT